MRRAFGQPPVERFFGVALGLRDQPDAVSALRMRYLDPALGAFGQRLRQQVGFGQCPVEQYAFRGRHILIKLREEAGKYLLLGQFLRMCREESAVPPILPATDEERLYPHHTIFVRQREDIGIANTLRVDRLAPLDEGQRLQPVAQHGSTFKIKAFRRAFHLFGKLGLHAR